MSLCHLKQTSYTSAVFLERRAISFIEMIGFEPPELKACFLLEFVCQCFKPSATMARELQFGSVYTNMSNSGCSTSRPSHLSCVLGRCYLLIVIIIILSCLNKLLSVCVRTKIIRLPRQCLFELWQKL